MLIFNGRKFAKNDKEFVASLFDAGGTCQGYYKRVKAGVKLYDHQRALQAFIVDNSHRERFVVSAYKTDKGDRFMFAASSVTEKWLGLEGLTFAGERSAVSNALETIA